jgi:DMSO/TMAO reductase YedYZ heme-binding membrane subunit
MLFPLTLLITTAMVFILQKPIKKQPVVFYLSALLLSGLYLYANYVDVSVYRWSWLLVIVQRSGVALSLFAIVMFTGVFAKRSSPREILYPLRRPLAITGAFLASGHGIVYAITYIPQLFSSEGRPALNIIVSIAISLVIAVLLVVLTATSFVTMRKLIAPARWKRVQTLAYPFFLLIFVHLVLILLPAAAAGAGTVIVNLIVYAALQHPPASPLPE